MRRVIIADINSRSDNGKAVGHYYTVAENYHDIFDDVCDVKVAGGPIFENRFDDLVKLDFDTKADNSTLDNKKKVIHNIKQLFAECANDIIILQCSAVATAYIGIALYKPETCKVFMIQYNTMGLDSFVKRMLYIAAKRKIDGVICPQKEIGEAYGCKYCIVPDYIYIGAKAQEIIPYEEKKYDFGIFGIIAPDKGVVEVARKLAGTKYSVMIGGFPQNDEIRRELEILCHKYSNIQLKLDYLSEEEYVNGIRNSRYCILNYSGAYSEHSSGVVFDIIFNGVPVVGKSCMSLNFIQDYGIGFIYDNIDDFNPDCVLNKERYNQFLHNISEYYESHKEYVDIIRKFVLG